jgi:uncharacterized protein involved in exopolysaccharide biosynthesis
MLMNETSDRSWEGGAVSGVDIVNIALRHWRLIVVLPLGLAIASGAWTAFSDRSYSASASFVPQSPETRTAGGASALALQFGLNIGGERPGQSPQFFADLLRSQPVLRAAVESEYTVPAGDGVRRVTLLEAVGERRSRNGEPPWLHAAERLRQSMNVSVGRETGIVRFSVSSRQGPLAEQIASRLLVILNEFNMTVRQMRAQEEVRFISGRLEEAQAGLLMAETGLQEFLQRNRQFADSPELLFEHERLQRQVAMRQDIYTTLLRSQEQARIDGVRDTPVLTTLEQPVATSHGPGILYRAILGFLLGLTLAVIIAVVAEISRRNRQRGDPRYMELEGLAREAWTDLRHPHRWVRRRGNAIAPGGG